ncbi:hypothetical protein C8Q75DRAFT_861828 [Abortiporus biennis]|nr:hypothetical protein C8Q75DRAFT_861828 [Abortiporus biennis]
MGNSISSNTETRTQFRDYDNGPNFQAYQEWLASPKSQLLNVRFKSDVESESSTGTVAESRIAFTEAHHTFPDGGTTSRKHRGASSVSSPPLPPKSHPTQPPHTHPDVNGEHDAIQPLLELYPQLDAHLLLDIINHNMHPKCIYKLDPYTENRARFSRNLLTMDGTTSTVNTAMCTPIQFCPLLSKYFQILNHYVTFSFEGGGGRGGDVANGMLKYFSRLMVLTLTAPSSWCKVLDFHFEFHERRLEEMRRDDYSGWGRRDGDLEERFGFE